MLNLFEHVHYPSFLLSSSNLMNLVPDGLLLSLALMPKLKRPWRQVWTLQLCSRPPLMQGLRVLFWMWIIWKIGNIILLKKKKKKKKVAEKDIWCAHTFCSLDCYFSVFTDFLRCWWLLKVGLSPSSLVNNKVQYTYCSISYELKATSQWNLVS